MTSPQLDNYRPGIDGLRAVAVVAVIINHFNGGLLPSGYLGVDIFFVISGYVITSSLIGRRSHSLADFLQEFYARRVKRLVPALVFCVLVTGLVTTVVNPNPATSLRTGQASLIGLSNIVLFLQATDYFAPAAALNTFTQTWSLGVEEQFYVVFPVLFWLTGAARHTANSLTRLGMLVGASSLLSVLAFVYVNGINQPAAYFLMPMRFWELGLGCLLCLEGRRTGSRLVAFLRSFSPNLVLGVTLAALCLPVEWSVAATIVVVGLTGGLVVAAGGEDFRCKALTHPVAVAIGLGSYSLYLWHWSVLSVSRWTVGLDWWLVPIQVVLMAALAFVSYRFIERPLRYATWAPTRWGQIAVGVAASIMAAAVLGAADSPAARRYLVDAADTGIAPVLDFVGPVTGRRAVDCHSSDSSSDALHGSMSLTPAFIADCLKAPDEAAPLWAFVGDSHTLSLFPLHDRLVERTSLGVFAHSRDGCAFPPQGPTTRKGCVETMESTTAFLLDEFKQRPGSVLVATSFLESHFGYDGRHRRQFTEHPRGERSDVDQNLKDYVDALATLAGRLGAEGSLVVVAPMPQYRGMIDVQLCAVTWFRPEWAVGRDCASAGRADLEAHRKPIVEALYALQREQPNVFVYDPFPALCPPSDWCDAYRSGRSMYSDANHLSEYGALLLYDDFLAFASKHGLLIGPTVDKVN